MKVLVKQACQIDDVVMGPNIHKKPGTFDVSGSLLLHPYFVLLMKDEKISIVEMIEKDFEELEASAKAQKIKGDDLDPCVIAACEKFAEEISKKKNEKEEDDEESDSSDSDSSDADSPEELEAGNGQADSEQEKLPSSENLDEVKKSEADEILKAEFDALHEKAKRLNKNEKKRYDELKAVLKIEE